jgi:hypothetical protein
MTTTTLLGVILGLVFSPVAIAVAEAAANGDLAGWGKLFLRLAMVVSFALFATTARAAGGRELAVYVSWR